jgi:hypothetical protein
VTAVARVPHFSCELEVETVGRDDEIAKHV